MWPGPPCAPRAHALPIIASADQPEHRQSAPPAARGCGNRRSSRQVGKGPRHEVGESTFLRVEDEELEAAREEAQARRPGAVTVQPPAPPRVDEAPVRRLGRFGGPTAPPVPSPAPEPPRVVVENTRTIDIE